MSSPSTIATARVIQANLLDYFRLFAGLPGITFVEEDVTWFVNANQGEPGDMVLRSSLSGDAVERRIDEILQQVSQLTDHLDWLVFPSCWPVDLGKRLASRGMKGGPGGTWMLADLAAPAGSSPGPDGFRIERVRDSVMLKQWREVSAEGFAEFGGDCQIFYDAYVRHRFGPLACSLHYIGYLDDVAVTSSTLLLSSGIAGIYDVSTLPPWRRHGFASAVTRAMVLEAQRRGYEHAWVWSSRMGIGVYRRAGFVAADLGIREYQWRKSET
jgi:GNAT superfamily N-acetyltransferase